MRTVTVLPFQSTSFSAWTMLSRAASLSDGRDGIFEIETDDIGRACGGLLEQRRPRARHEQLGTVKAQRRLALNGGEAHRKFLDWVDGTDRG